MKKRIPEIGIITCILYFISVALFLITKADLALTLWETLTIFSAPILLILLLDLAKLLKASEFGEKAMVAFAACNCAATGIAHIVNISVTRKLIADGVDVPEYLRIGFWPSAEMAVDYIGWGFFMGLAFLAVGLAIHSSEKIVRRVKLIVIICGALCLIGCAGAFVINENMWYIAPIGYGIGPIVICIYMIRIRKLKLN